MGTGKPRISTAVQLVDRVLQVELALGPVAVPELELDPAAAEREPVPVVVELELGQVAALAPVIGPAVVPELETAQVAARELVTGLAVGQELERDPVVALALALDQVVVALRIRLVTAAHPHDLVPLLAAAEDLAAAAAETSLERAAAEAAIAWEAVE